MGWSEWMMWGCVVKGELIIVESAGEAVEEECRRGIGGGRECVIGRSKCRRRMGGGGPTVGGWLEGGVQQSK